MASDDSPNGEASMGKNTARTLKAVFFVVIIHFLKKETAAKRAPWGKFNQARLRLRPTFYWQKL